MTLSRGAALRAAVLLVGAAGALHARTPAAPFCLAIVILARCRPRELCPPVQGSARQAGRDGSQDCASPW